MQGWLCREVMLLLTRQETKKGQSAYTGQSPSVASHIGGESSSASEGFAFVSTTS